jgi:hypothetical protein
VIYVEGRDPLFPQANSLLCILCGKSCISPWSAFLCSGFFFVFREIFLGADCTQYTTLRCLQDDPSLKWHWVDPAKPNILKGQSRWLRGFRHDAAVAALLGLRV